MAPPKRELALTGAAAGADRESAKRLRVGVVTAASASAAGWPVPVSPGKRLMRRSVLVVLFLLRMNDSRTTVAESISGSMVHKFQEVLTLMMSKLENLEGKLEKLGDKMEGKLEKLGDKMEGMSLEVKKLARLLSSRNADQQPRQEPHQKSATASGSNANNFHLCFLNGLRTPVYTEKKITSENNSAIRIGIFDASNTMIREGPLSKMKVEMLVLRGDFCNDGRESWTEEEFNSHVVQGRHGQGYVLGGDCSVWLNNGEASFGVIRFKEGSSRTRSRKFVVGARVCMDGKTADRVQEAVMMPVTVLDRRNEANEKKHPPKLDDEVYRLEEICKDGTYRKRLNKAKIFTVKDFLKALNKDANKLREEILQIKKHSSSWGKMVKHARECCLTDRHELKAYQNVEGNVVLFLNCVHDLVGAKFSGIYISQENFDPAKKALAYELKECARDQLDNLPFNYVMNGDLPEQVPSSAHSSLDAVIIVPGEALQGTTVSGNQFHDRINRVTEPPQQNGYVHGDQNTANTQFYYQGEEIAPSAQQQHTTLTALMYFDGDLSDLFFQGSSQVNIHSQMQVPISMDGGGAMEASTYVQNNLLPQEYIPTQFQGSMPGMRYPENLPNPVAEAEPPTWHDDRLPEPEPSAYQFPGPNYGNVK